MSDHVLTTTTTSKIFLIELSVQKSL